MSSNAALKLSLRPLCWRSNIPIDWGLYRAEYFTSMFNLDIMSLHRLAVKLAPLSDVTTDGTPYKLVQWCRKAVAASEDDGSFNGMA